METMPELLHESHEFPCVLMFWVILVLKTRLHFNVSLVESLCRRFEILRRHLNNNLRFPNIEKRSLLSGYFINIFLMEM